MAGKAKKNTGYSMSRALVRRETIAGYAFMLPNLIFFVGFVIYPMIQCVITSFFDSTMNRADIFVGLGNYIELFQDGVFLRALWNTIIIVVVSVPVTCIFSLWVSSIIYDLKGPLCSPVSYTHLNGQHGPVHIAAHGNHPVSLHQIKTHSGYNSCLLYTSQTRILKNRITKIHPQTNSKYSYPVKGDSG